MKGYKRSPFNLIGRRVSLLIIFCAHMLILASTLFPYDFCFKETNSSLLYNVLSLGWGKSTVYDVIINFAMFLPLGFVLGYYLVQVRRLKGLKSLATTVLVSFGLSYIIEVLQIFLPSRFPSLNDVFSNSAGGVAGFLCFILLESKVQIIDNNSVFLKRNLQLSIFGYIIFALFISASLQHFSSLSNWDKAFPLLLGNERTGARLWQGHVSELYIADRAFSKTEVAHIFSEKTPIASLLAKYQFMGIEKYHDEMRNLPDLIWRGEPQGVQRSEGVFLGSNHWLETVSSATSLTQRLMVTNQFTLSVTFATNNTTQKGPARIVSLSEDPRQRNFTLGLGRT